MIPVVKPFLPPLEEYIAHLQEIWKTGILTHNGPYVRRLEAELKKVLKFQSENVVAVANGTLAIQLALRAMNIKGEVITSAFSWIATVSAIAWEGCTPVFADVDAENYNLDPDRVRQLITPKTAAIVPVHTFGNPCNVEAFDEISKEYRIPIIYDAAHALGTTFKGKSVLGYGDASAVSLHATKVLNTGEGGAVITGNAALDGKMRRLRFFGYDDTKEIVDFGTNFKMSEINAALGVTILPHFDKILERRKFLSDRYRANLSNLGERIRFQRVFDEGFNCAYFSVVFENETALTSVIHALAENNITARRYFHPSLNTVYPQYAEKCPVSESLASRIACLPLYQDLETNELDFISEIIVNRLEH